MARASNRNPPRIRLELNPLGRLRTLIGTAFPTFQAVRDLREMFSSVMATAGARPLSMTDGDRREQVFAELVTADFLGQRLRTHDGVLEVIGVVKDAKYLSLAETAEPFLYRPIAQSETDNPALSLAVRTVGDPMQMRAAIEHEVKSLMPSWPSFQFRTLDEGVELQRSLPRFGATLLGVLGTFGALLAAVGIYGVIAYVVQRRSREIGIRLALGAACASVLGLMIRQGMSVCAAGGALGLLTALGVTQATREFRHRSCVGAWCELQGMAMRALTTSAPAR